MKRCNNCGWFNLDSAESCEKCGDESFDLEEPLQETDNFEEKEEKEEENTTVCVSESDESVVDHPSVGSPIMGTVAYGSETPVMPKAAPSKKVLAATVMDASAVLNAQETVQCPKCRYPITGFVEYCPNCGATIKNRSAAMSESPRKTQPEPVSSPSPATPAPAFRGTVREGAPIVAKAGHSVDLKATVRDIPRDLIHDEVYRLVRVDNVNEAPIEMVLGAEVLINGCRYRFEK